NTVIGHHLVEETRNTTVSVMAANQVVALFEKTLGDGGHGRHTAGKNMGRRSTFQGGKVLLQAGTRGIGDARVFISLVFTEFLLNISGGGKNRDRDCAGSRVGFLANVYSFCGKSW